MVNQANKFQNQADRTKYLDACARFRLPYWDPLMPRKKQKGTDISTVWGLPELFKRPQVYLKTPGSPNKFVLTTNPMFQFIFPTETEYAGTTRPRLVQSNRCNKAQTARSPGTNGQSDNSYLDQVIQQQGVALANKFWKMMSPDEVATNPRTGAQVYINQLRPWSFFANHNAEYGISQKLQIDGQAYSTVSLESWHDGVHVMIGQGIRGGKEGQMGDPTVSGFEPMFWMHHCNVDRLLSLYQALYAKNVDDTDQLNAGLSPFMKNAKRDLWTSNDDMIKNYWSPGYAMPGNKAADPKQIQDLVKLYLTSTYYWATTQGTLDKATAPTDWPKDLSRCDALYGGKTSSATNPRISMVGVSIQDGILNLVNRAVFPLSAAVSTGAAAKIPMTENVIYPDQAIFGVSSIINNLFQNVLHVSPTRQRPAMQVWDCHVRVKKFAFDGSFSVHVFIGDVNNDQTDDFMINGNQAGFMGIFSRSREAAAHCVNCENGRNHGLIISDMIPLTTHLTNYLQTNPNNANRITQGQRRYLSSLEPRDVVPFLKDQLRWRMIDLSSNLISDQEQDAQLIVAVTNRTYTPPNNAHLMGVYGPEIRYEIITNGKPGGCGYTYGDGSRNTWDD